MDSVPIPNNEICRLCLQESNFCKNFLEDSILTMLRDIFLDRFQFNEGLACKDCEIKLKQTHEFIQMIIETQSKIATKSIKQEHVESSLINEINIKQEENCINVVNSYKCSKCKEEFVDLDLLANHTKTIHKHHFCIKCKSMFKTKRLYNAHIKNCESEIANNLIKNECKTNSICSAGKNNKKKSTNKSRKRKISETSESEIEDDIDWDNYIEPVVNDNKESENKEKSTDETVRKRTETESSESDQNEIDWGVCIKKPVVKDSNQKDTKRICYICGSILRTSTILRRHINAHNQEKIQCDLCGKLVANKRKYTMHMEQHNGNPKFDCSQCEKKFYGKKQLTRHINRKHLKIRTDPCIICNKSFSSNYTLKAHMRQHTNEMPFACEICGDAFKHNVSLRTHKKSKHNIIEQVVCSCKVCGKGFASEGALLTHERIH